MEYEPEADRIDSVPADLEGNKGHIDVRAALAHKHQPDKWRHEIENESNLHNPPFPIQLDVWFHRVFWDASVTVGIINLLAQRRFKGDLG